MLLRRTQKQQDVEQVNFTNGLDLVTQFCDPGGRVIEIENFQRFLRGLYDTTVFSFGKSSLTINLASLHRIELLKLQRQLLEEALDARYQKSDITTLRSPTTHKYCKDPSTELELGCLLTKKPVQALADWESIKACAANGRMDDPFILTTSRLRDLTLIREEISNFARKATTMTADQQAKYEPSKISQDTKSLEAFPKPHDKGKPDTLFGGSRTEMHRKTKFENFLQRLIMAGVGGAFLIGPMLIMVLKNTLLASLLTTAICVVVFGFTLAVYLDQPFNVLSGTAAYAAVLVVFVGTSSSNS
jgi:hypothetical protein